MTRQNQHRSWPFVGLLLLISLQAVPGQPIDSVEFVNVPVRDILVALGSATGNPVVVDQSVSGTTSVFFEDTDFDAALEQLVSTHNLFARRLDSVVEVSAIRIGPREDGLYDVDAAGVDIGIFIDSLSRETLAPVTHRQLPTIRFSYHAQGVSVEEVLVHLATTLPGYQLEAVGPGYHIGPVSETSGREPVVPIVVQTDNGYTTRVAREYLTVVLTSLFAATGREFLLLKRSDPLLTALACNERSFEETLTRVCEAGDANWVHLDGTYYILDAEPLDAIARTHRAAVYRPEFRTVAELLDCLPVEATAGLTIRADRHGQSICISGVGTIVERLLALVEAIDRVPVHRSYHRFVLHGIDIGRLPSLLPNHLSGLTLTPAPDGASFLVFATENQAVELDRFLSALDVPTDPEPPASLTYQILIVQVEDGTSSEYSLDLSGNRSGPLSTATFAGALGHLQALDFNVVAAFGYEFAARLNAQIENSEATVIAGTTLGGVPGESAVFSSTNTYRYLDHTQGETGMTSVVREITSGLVVAVNGTLDESGIIAMDISASLSSRGSASEEGSPPSTSEKRVETRVRTGDGCPVVVTGLVQSGEQEQTAESPVLRRIPVLQRVFQRRDRTSSGTELLIYVVPRLHLYQAVDHDPDSQIDELSRRIFGEQQ